MSMKHLTEDERLFYASIQLALKSSPDNKKRIAWTNSGLAHMAEIMGTLDRERAEIATLKAERDEALDALADTHRELTEITDGEDCDHEVGICWCATFRAIENAAAILRKHGRLV